MNAPLNIAVAQNGASHKPPTQWQTVGLDVLSVLAQAHETALHEKALFECGLAVTDFPPGQQQQLFTAIENGRAAAVSLTPHSLAAASGVALDWIMSDVVSRYDILVADTPNFMTNVQTLKNYALRAHFIRILDNTRTRLVDGRETADKLIETHMSDLLKNVTGGLPQADAEAVSLLVDNVLDGELPRLVQSGIGWLDTVTGGMALDKSEIWALAGRYKGRKSSVAYHINLALLRAGASVTIMSYDENRETVGLQFVAMLGIEWLLERGLYFGFEAGQDNNWLSASQLYKAGRNYRTWSKTRVEAVNYGRSEFAKLKRQLRIYDVTRDGGGLHDIQSVKRIVTHDTRRYGANFHMVDYIQRIKGAGDFIANQQENIMALQDISRTLQVSMLWLAQQNEEGVKRGEKDQSQSADIKGGGALSAAVDYLLMTQYGYKDPAGDVSPERLKLVLKQARRCASGGNLMQEFSIHAGTGYILEEVYS